MEQFRAGHFLQNRRAFWIISALTIVLFVVTNLPWELDDYDQAKQAFTSFEMIKDGHWLYQETPHDKVATKPPLVGWISAGLFAVVRSWAVAWRLPSLVAALGISILLFGAAKSVYGAVAGLIGLSAFGLNLLSPRLATLVRTDMPLALVIFLIGLQLWMHIREQRGWDVRDRWLLFVLLTAAMLIKGPIVYAFLLPGIVTFRWIRRRDGGHYSWSGWWPWVASLAIFLLWVIGGIYLEPGFFDRVVVREFLARFGETVHRPQPLLFYVPHLLHKFFPWSVLMMAIAMVDLHSRRWEIREAFRGISPETLWLICWIFGGLFVMSLIPSKRVDRIFPIIPPLCLLLAAQIGNISRNEEWRERVYRWSAVALFLSILFTGSSTLAKVISGYRGHRDALVIFGRAVRQDAARHHWRYEAITARDEGMLLYLERTHFIEPDRAVSEWNRGNLDAVVVPTEEAPDLMRQLHDAALSQLRSSEKKDEQGIGYVWITR
jgi:4-amino-4-deoxy-L-arabinose transferase-like glycosyltransferase